MACPPALDRDDSSDLRGEERRENQDSQESLHGAPDILRLDPPPPSRPVRCTPLTPILRWQTPHAAPEAAGEAVPPCLTGRRRGREILPGHGTFRTATVCAPA